MKERVRPLALSLVLICLMCLACATGWAAESTDAVRRAAMAGDAASANRLGVWYEKGKQGLPCDPAQAVSWYRKAAQAGNVLAMHNLGDCYRNGVGVDRDTTAALEWYTRAAEAGGAIGYEDLGDFFRDIGLVQPSHATAVMWYGLAVRHGREGAAQKLRAMGAPVPAPGKAKPVPCPRRVVAEREFAGEVKGVRVPDDQSSGRAYLVLSNATGQKEVLLADAAQGREFAAIYGPDGAPHKGVRLRLRYVEEHGLDVCTARCGTVARYVPGSAQVTGNVPPPPDAGTMVYVGVNDLMLGAHVGGAWVPVEVLQKNPHYHDLRLWGGENGRLFTSRGPLGACTITALFNEHPEQHADRGPEADFPFYEAQLPGGVPDDLEWSLFLGGAGATFDPQPRAARILKGDAANAAEYAGLVKSYLTAQGLPEATVRIKSVTLVDVDGDGVDEAFICAEDFKGSQMTPPMAGTRGMYSVVLLAGEKNGLLVPIPLSSWLALKDVSPEEGKLPVTNGVICCADVNGDGVLEIITHSNYYEGMGMEVYEWNRGAPRLVLEGGFGV